MGWIDLPDKLASLGVNDYAVLLELILAGVPAQDADVSVVDLTEDAS